MPGDLPEFYFRVRDNGALVFRIDRENRLSRVDMDQIATVNVRNGEVKAHGDRTLSEADMAAIRAWVAERAADLARREYDDILRIIDQLNQAAHWAQARASEAQLDAVTDRLLMAMHDLRSVLVRRKGERRGEG
jgi:hypothetical protein